MGTDGLAYGVGLNAIPFNVSIFCSLLSLHVVGVLLNSQWSLESFHHPSERRQKHRRLSCFDSERRNDSMRRLPSSSSHPSGEVALPTDSNRTCQARG